MAVLMQTWRVLVMVLMSVVPQLGLIQQEKENQSNKKCYKQVVRRYLSLESLWQQMQECCGQQRTGGQTQHVLGVTCQHAKA